MEAVAKFIDALSGLAWPALFLFLGWYFRSQIAELFHLIKQQIASGGAFKWRELEIKGVDLLSFDKRDGRTFRRELADSELFTRRHESYEKNKNLFLVHRVRPTGRLHETNKLPTFDISIYLVPHKSFGHLNDVKEVSYYLGQYFGLSEGEYGTKYIVQNGSEGFAVKLNAYGPTLCEARIAFHDGTQTTVSRYLDFEGTGYQFHAPTNVVDVKTIIKRKKGV